MEIGVALEYPAEFVVIRITQFDRGTFTSRSPADRLTQRSNTCHTRTIPGGSDSASCRPGPQLQVPGSDVPLRRHPVNRQIGEMGFMVVEGIAMNTDMVQYREGGWNTNPHKLPGQTDFAPLTCSAGVFYTKPGMWNLAKQMFSVQWGAGHHRHGRGVPLRHGGACPRPPGHRRTQPPARPVTHRVPSSPSPSTTAGRRSIGFNNLSAMENAVLVHQMQVHHEGFDVFYGNAGRRAT